MKIVLIGLLFLAGAVLAQDTNETVEASLLSEKFERIRDLQESIALYQEQIAEARKQIKEATGESQKQELMDQLEDYLGERKRLNEALEELSVGAEVDRSLFSVEKKETFDLRNELEKLIEPVVTELKNTTAESRIIKEKEAELMRIRERRQAATAAVRNLRALLEGNPPADVRASLESQETQWMRRLSAATSEEESSRLQLEEQQRGKQSWIESSRRYFTNFMRSRGLHLLLGILAFCTVFFGMRGLYALYRRARPLQPFRSFASRAIALAYHIITILGAVGAMLLVFNVTGDWFLLTLSMFFLIGVGWVSIKTLPTMFEQVKLMLNFGAVREHELLMFDGIPWEVEDLGLMARLRNPRLSGGEQILPIRDLVGLVSRRPAKAERWFPCEAGEWIRLEDGTLGQVRVQTPSHVEVERLGGSYVTYPTPQFYQLAPENLSDGFRIDQSFGIDYRHQAESTDAIPAQMLEALRGGVLEIVSEGELLDLVVELKGAGSSSLDYAVQAVFTGSAADRYERLERALPTLLVRACNEHGWTIPFTQITLHQAGGDQ